MSNTKWRQVPIGCLCTGIYDGPHATPTKTVTGPVFLGISCLNQGRLDLSEAEHLSEIDYPRWTRRVIPQADDVVFSYETRLGEAAIIPEGLRCCLGRRMALMRPDRSKVDPRFLLYAYLSPQFQEVIRQRTVHGSTVDRILLTEFADFPVSIPPLSVQRALVSVLGALDDKIELNRRMNETLEAIARAIFKSWFVDFDPVRAKAEGRQPVGMDTETAALFPDAFKETELGEVPVGWGVGTLRDVSMLNAESWTRATMPKVIRYVDLSNTKWGRISSITPYKKEDAPSRAQRVLRTADTIIGTVRPGNGSYALIQEEGLTGSTGFAALRPMCVEHREFVYLAATAEENIGELSRLADGAAYPAVRPEIVAESPVILAPRQVLASFSRLTAPLLSMIGTSQAESVTLANIRDLLLPKLLSGEVRVEEEVFDGRE